MQKCDKCNTQFSWSEIFKSYIWIYTPIECRNCGTVHKITLLGRLTFVSYTIVPALVFFHFISPFENFALNFGIQLIILLVGSLFTPYVVRYKGIL
ncbi:hypothetical protein LCL96_01855 [Rossellomorea aquimaris]|uniref:TIGR04104 family putative zinc finger protein n=1 Tax=Rossellomorea aquimaris TaxID=189382 RepID=UPI001CD1F264|nr:hypothetical protein [Rossellomorea aquimaris]